MLTTTYASIAASRTARPPTLTATRRAAGDSSTTGPAGPAGPPVIEPPVAGPAPAGAGAGGSAGGGGAATGCPAPPSGVVISGRRRDIDGHRRVVVRQQDRDRRTLLPAARRQGELALVEPLGLDVDPDVAGRAAAGAGHDRAERRGVGRDRHPVRVVAVDRVDALDLRVLRGLHQLHDAAVGVEDRRRVDDAADLGGRRLGEAAGGAL